MAGYTGKDPTLSARMRRTKCGRCGKRPEIDDATVTLTLTGEVICEKCATQQGTEVKEVGKLELGMEER